MKKLNMYTDGAAKGNPGPGGYGTVIHFLRDDGLIEKKKELTGGESATTNNRMELLGVITGLTYVTEPSEITITTDSQYIVKAFQDKWLSNWIAKGWKTSKNKPVKNRDLWELLLKVSKIHQVSYVWVKGHDGHPENERCDYLASSSASGVVFTEKEDGTLTELTPEENL